ncbi:hypothetical protein E5K00_05295 [Hymenobacter aquaticus]|uniref:Glycosyltransferase RgtA/B/C/D-like domain-containing protein n=1 Tax=Hymenobacter aquaticus TaxID=1867101 RepID=A0A4Z0Q6E9_9BACT|nr:hypothetical protein [Hymenobacter aquaticus]TGE24631.1 hypothetical protein E5K00_05295 [Hymenobacter aquaticus]
MLNGLLLGGLVLWGRRQYQVPGLGRWLLPLLALKLVAGAAACYLLSEDGAYYQRWGLALTEQLWERPGKWLQTLAGDYFWHGGASLTFHGYSNSFFLIKLLSGLNLASRGSLLLNGLYLSVFCFVGSWELTAAVARALPATPRGAPLVAFLLWPTVVYWTAGLTKECLLLGSGAWLLALVVRWLYGAEAPRPATLAGAVALAVLQFKMRFFFAALLFAALAGLAVIRLTQHLGGARRRWVQAALFAATLSVGGWGASEISPVFRLNKFTNQLIRINSDLLAGAQARPHIEYEHLAPTVESMLRNAPQAIGSALLRPMPWEDAAPLYVGAGLENLLLLAVLGALGVALWRRQPGQLPFALVLALGFYCLALAALLGLSTPNLGTLSRYRSALLPYLLLLALQHDVAARWLRRIGL